ncbi:uncharacterized protein LOC127801161 [Diospyros lotus]|uniref:uncharacterized protein LOC127801161 n=1 Tax=Diospyros lotus TaxID=55363 RepID=UPI00225582DB|nr:uncharacterized protein LOC127801161 [Diospyros lotus]
MSVACLEGATVVDFVEDGEVFEKCVEEHFARLADGKGELSRLDLEERSGSLGSGEFELQSKEEIRKLYDTLFDKFDAKQKGAIDGVEFRSLMREIMLAKARGMGHSPVLVILQPDSLLMKAVLHGLACEHA